MKSTKPLLKFVVDPFCFKQFDKEKAGLSFINFQMNQFLDKIQQIYDSEETVTLKDGYAPFCKHIFVNNFTDTVSAFIKITPENEKYLKSGYQARNEKELPVLGRWFDHSQMPEGTVGKA